MEIPKTPKGGFRRFREEHRNCLWQADLKYGPYLQDPGNPKKTRRTYLLAFIDDFSRLMPHAEFYFEQKLPALEDCLRKAILKRGIPDEVYVDQGRIFVSRWFRIACARLNVRHLAAKPYAPEAIGRLRYAVEGRKFGLFTGEVGSGKSTAARVLASGLNPAKYQVL